MSCKVRVLCFNMDFPSSTCYQHQKEYFRLLITKPDLVLLQEAKTGTMLQGCFRDYGITYSKEGDSKCTCILYNKAKFEYCRRNRLSLEADLESRTHVVTLKCKNVKINKSVKIIVGSCHLPYKTDKKKQNAELLFKALNKLQQYSKYPLLIAGDFNCGLKEHRVDRQKFELPTYEITEHRRACAGRRDRCIDYFAYKNYDNHVNIQLNDVVADNIVRSDSRHDPLRATMTISAQSYWNLLSFNMNKNESEKVTSYFNNLRPQPNIWFLHDINTPQNHFKEKFTTNSSPWSSRQQTLLVFNTSTFQIQFPTHAILHSVEVYTYEVHYQGYKTIVALCHKLNDITREDVEELFTTLNGRDHSVIAVGDFNIYKILKEYPDLDKRGFKVPTYKPTIHRAIYGGVDDACIDFFAYKNVTSNGIKPVLANFTITAEMIECPGHIITEVDGQCYVDTGNSTLAEVHNISPHDPLRAELLIEIKSPPLQLICINITNTHSRQDQVADHIIGYCRDLNPKPDLYIFLNLTESIATRIEDFDDEYEYPTFITSREYISFENEDDRMRADLEYFEQDECTYMCTFQHIRTPGSPKIIVAAIDLDNSHRLYDIEKYFGNLSQKEYPTLIAGHFGVDLLADVHKYGFKVANHHSSSPATGNDFITYKNSIAHSSAIVLRDVYTDRTAHLGFYVMKATLYIKVKPTIPL